MPEIVQVILAVLFVLGVAINIHEFGHFIVAKMLGMRVEAFSFFGLGPRIWGFKVGHTDYRISAIPLGAYVKLYGDEATSSLEGGESTGEKVPDDELYELRPRWQKFLVLVGGPFMNIILALAIPFVAAMAYGIPSLPAPVVGTVKVGGAAEKAGIQKGDRIVSFAGQEDPTIQRIDMDAKISPEMDVPVIVERAGQKIPLTIRPEKVIESGNAMGDVGFTPDAGVQPVIVGALENDMPAFAAGLKLGDRVLFFNGETVRNPSELKQQIGANQGAPAKLTIEREGVSQVVEIAPKQDASGVFRIGIGFAQGLITAREKAGVGEAANYAVTQNLEIIRLTGKVFGQLFSGQRSVKDSGLSSPIGIVGMIKQVVLSDGFVGLIPMLALISLNLGVFNLLPIPLLDGGQIVVLGIEKVLSWFGKTLSMAVRERIQLAGLAVILTLMAFTMFMDISKWF